MKSDLLRHAEHLIRTRGYTGFSYADLAEKAAIRKASVHHYFRTKEDLGVAIVGEYLGRFRSELQSITDSSPNVEERLVAYARIFTESLEGGMLPLCGALSAESFSLPERMQPLVAEFFSLHLDWLRAAISEGIASGEFRPDISVDIAAVHLLSTLEGGSLIAWALDDNAVHLAGFAEALKGILK